MIGMGKIILYDPAGWSKALEELLDSDEPERSSFASFKDDDKLIFYLEEINEDVDILIVNAVVQRERGLKLARTCREKIGHLKLVLLTGSLDQPDRLFELRPDYLFLLPIDKARLKQAVNRLRQMTEREYKRCLTVNTKGKIYRIPYDQILYAESSGRQMNLVTWEEKITIYGKLDQLLAQLPPYFLHCHKSYVINLNYVRQLEMYRLKLQGKSDWIPVSQKHYKELRERLLAVR